MPRHLFRHTAPFPLEAGGVLPGFELAYHTYGQLNEDRSNVVWVCHALTANSEPEDWWPGLVGPGTLLDPARYFIVCANMPGSCYGSTYALSLNPETQAPWFHDFPMLTNRDIARSFDLLRQSLGLESVFLGIGGSLGGQQLLEWAVMQPGLFQHLVPIATNARHSPWGIAFNEAQRMAIAADETWATRDPRAGLRGLLAARAIALLSYRSYDAYGQSQLDEDSKLGEFRASSYQQYQGKKLVNRFDAFAYWTLSQAMDSHHLGRGRGSIEAALGTIGARCLVIGIETDVLFPPEEQRFLAAHIPRADFALVPSDFGHDGFLIEVAALTRYIDSFLAR